MLKTACVDLFCGAGGLTHGFVLEGVPVVAGIDLDPACRFPYEANNQARFVERDISKVTLVDGTDQVYVGAMTYGQPVKLWNSAAGKLHLANTRFRCLGKYFHKQRKQL